MKRPYISVAGVPYASPEEIHRMVVIDLIALSKAKAEVSALTDWTNDQLICGKMSDARLSPVYIRKTSFMAFASLWQDFLLEQEQDAFYSWRMTGLKIISTQAVDWMHAMRAAGLYPIGLAPGRQWLTNDDGATFTMLFQSEGDMVAGAALYA